MRIVSQQLIDFTSLTNSSQSIVLARRIDASQWREGIVYLRFHNGTSIATGPGPSALTFGIYNDGYTDEDPAAITASNSPSFLTVLGTATDITGSAAQQLKVINLTTPFGSMLAFLVSCTQGASPVTCRLLISVDLILKD
jgi:hypothetical protein